MYIRNCPSCKKKLSTKNKYWHNKSILNNTRCLSCTGKGRKFSEIHKEKLKKNHADVSGKNNPFFGKHHTDEVLKKISEINKGKDRFSKEYKKYLSKKMTGSGNPFYRKTHSEKTKLKLSLPKSEEHRKKLSISLKGKTLGIKRSVPFSQETKKKMRISAIIRMKRTFGENVFHPNVNMKEIEFFKKLEQERGWNGIYFNKDKIMKQFFINSLGYWVDFYEPAKNIVVEYDETSHYDADWKLKQKDILRQEEIILELNCEFYRYNEALNELKRYN